MPKTDRRLLIASNNAAKVSELRELLGDCGWQIVSPADIGLGIDVEESGASYADNARLKAEAFAHASGLAALADDSGLEVDALRGEPGVQHHLLGWDGRDQQDQIAILLRALKDVPPERRTALFRAVIVVVMPGGTVLQEEGVCEGVIGEAPSGEGGFGYDPVFVLPNGVTVAQLSEAEKNRVSHRGLAAQKMSQRLRDFV